VVGGTQRVRSGSWRQAASVWCLHCFLQRRRSFFLGSGSQVVAAHSWMASRQSFAHFFLLRLAGAGADSTSSTSINRGSRLRFVTPLHLHRRLRGCDRVAGSTTRPDVPVGCPDFWAPASLTSPVPGRIQVCAGAGRGVLRG